MIETRRGTFEIFTAGRGNPLCIAHLFQEFTTDGSDFANSLAEFFNVTLVNLKNMGNSSKVQHWHELFMKDTVQDLESIRLELGFSKWSYAGHSTGGFLGLTYGILAIDALDALILCGSAASREFTKSENCIYNFKSGQHRKEMQKIFFTLFSPFASKSKQRKANRKLIELSLYKPEKYDEYFSDKLPSRTIKKRMMAYNRELKTYDVRDRMERITIPTLILCGRHDVQCPVSSSEEMHSLIANSRLVIFENSNHVPFIEENEAFVSSIGEFASTNQLLEDPHLPYNGNDASLYKRG